MLYGMCINGFEAWEFQNFWKVSSNFEHHSKPTMNINSQHHNLLGNQISPKSKMPAVAMETANTLNLTQR
jgi:hypothetical protein